MEWKPTGYPSLSPYLIVPDAEAVLAFAEAVFDATRLRVIQRPGGGIMHAECRIDDGVLMMGEMPGGPSAHVHLYLPDPDAALVRARTQGGTLAQPMTETGDGDRRGGVLGPGGVTWWLSRQIEAQASDP